MSKSSKLKTEKDKELIIVYTDGSCSGNGKSYATGGIGIHFPNRELKDISKVFDMTPVTNQRAELYAILTSLRYIKKNLGLRNYQVLLKTDSKYSIQSITKWVNGWVKNGWKTVNGDPVANREFIETIYNYTQKYSIFFEHVSAHTNGDDDDSIANAVADELATKATQKAYLEKNGITAKVQKLKINKNIGGSKSNKKTTVSLRATRAPDPKDSKDSKDSKDPKASKKNKNKISPSSKSNGNSNTSSQSDQIKKTTNNYEVSNLLYKYSASKNRSPPTADSLADNNFIVELIKNKN